MKKQLALVGAIHLDMGKEYPYHYDKNFRMLTPEIFTSKTEAMKYASAMKEFMLDWFKKSIGSCQANNPDGYTPNIFIQVGELENFPSYIHSSFGPSLYYTHRTVELIELKCILQARADRAVKNAVKRKADKERADNWKRRKVSIHPDALKLMRRSSPGKKRKS